MPQSIPGANIPPGKFFNVVKSPAKGKIFMQKHGPWGNKVPTVPPRGIFQKI